MAPSDNNVVVSNGTVSVSESPTSKFVGDCHCAPPLVSVSGLSFAAPFTVASSMTVPTTFLTLPDETAMSAVMGSSIGFLPIPSYSVFDTTAQLET